MFIHYMLVQKIIETIDLYFTIPVSDYCMLCLYIFIAIIFTLTAYILYKKYGDRNSIENSEEST